ncbi:nucleotidyltransferase family protein [Sphingorhabdus arenilitoris]|uniref:Nucleotidyltransferase family protein n=1 Tax=Sphingorhabdus arenilitoris TaxID=1490041 RepID=A0ABV8RGZ8_9SPHN
MSSARQLVAALRDPASVQSLSGEGWTALITIARAEQLLGTLACKLQGMDMPPPIAAALADARLNVEYQHRSALWEADCARRALSEYPGAVVLLKGTAYVAAGLRAGEGRHIGDLDILVAADGLPEAEAALTGNGGWEWVKEDAYDDAYYRDHMHELPPLIHKERDRMIDVHHTILPLTARPKPDAAAMLQDAIPLPPAGGVRVGQAYTADKNPPPAPPATGRGELFVFTPEDMACHCAAHLMADGDLTGGLRNLWDYHCLTQEFAEQTTDFWAQLERRASHHQLLPAVQRAARVSAHLFGTEIPPAWRKAHWQDGYYSRRLLARDEWGRGTHKFTRLLFYIRSHWLRMPPAMLARHLWTKWRKG